MSVFSRTRFTWLAYGMFAYFAFLQLSLGPILPFLRRELNLSYSIGGLHASAFAAGMIITGLLGDRIAQRLGNHVAFWSSGAGMAIAALVFISGKTPFVTVFATFIMGLFGALLMVMVQAGLADAHPRLSHVAYLESTLVAAVATTTLPLWVGLFEQLGLGWRNAIVMAVLGWALLSASGWRVKFPCTDRATAHPSGARARGGSIPLVLPQRFWVYWVALFLGVSAEWCMILWSAEFFIIAADLAPATASFLLTAFAAAGMCGRWVGSRIAHQIPATQLLLIYAAILLVGFPLFWLEFPLGLRVMGLFVVGFGAAGLFPLGVAAATETASEQSKLASTRITLAVGLAIFINPQALGLLADVVSIQTAFLMVPILVILMMGLVWTAHRTIG